MSRPGAQALVRVGTPLKVPSVVMDEAAAAVQAPTAQFTVTYVGFTPQAKAAFQRAVNIWSRQITSSVPITVSASFEPLGTNVLGSAGPSHVWRDFTGAPQAGTWYVDALANKRHGSQLYGDADIVARFSSDFTNWHYGSGPAPTGQFDFTSVVLHELGHGVGFLGAGNVAGTAGTVRYSGYPISYDRYTETSSGSSLLGFADNSTALGSALIGNAVVFDSRAVRAVTGERTAKLHAPSPWEPGSSYSHLSETAYPAGNPNSLMTPGVGAGETIRRPGAITKATLTTIGW